MLVEGLGRGVPSTQANSRILAAAVGGGDNQAHRHRKSADCLTQNSYHRYVGTE